MSENFKILTRKYGSIQETALIHYRYQGSFFAPSPAVAQIIYTNVIGNLYTDICPILDRIAEGVSGAHFAELSCPKCVSTISRQRVRPSEKANPFLEFA